MCSHINNSIRLCWNEGLKDEFLLNFRNKLTNTTIDTIANTSENINRAVETIIDIYTSAAKCMTKPLIKRKIPLRSAWWDADCDHFKQQKYSALRKFRKSNLDADLRNYKSERASFKNVCRLKKHSYQQHCRRDLMDASKDPKKFWQTVKISQPHISPGISDSQWYDYFKALLFSDNLNIELADSGETQVDPSADVLNEKIILSEVISAIKALKNGKCAAKTRLVQNFIRILAFRFHLY